MLREKKKWENKYEEAFLNGFGNSENPHFPLIVRGIKNNTLFTCIHIKNTQAWVCRLCVERTVNVRSVKVRLKNFRNTEIFARDLQSTR